MTAPRRPVTPPPTSRAGQDGHHRRNQRRAGARAGTRPWTEQSHQRSAQVTTVLTLEPLSGNWGLIVGPGGTMKRNFGGAGLPFWA